MNNSHRDSKTGSTRRRGRLHRANSRDIPKICWKYPGREQQSGKLSPKGSYGVETDISTNTIRKALQLVVIVFVKLDGIICRLNGEEYWKVFWDCFRCKSAALRSLSSWLMCIQGYKRLWGLEIHHQDISNGNTMFCWKNCHLFGVLIDFDLAFLEGIPSQNQRRTGNRSFMAYRLLADGLPISHAYKYDAESFSWVAVYDSASQSSAHGWGNLDNSTVAAQNPTISSGALQQSR